MPPDTSRSRRRSHAPIVFSRPGTTLFIDRVHAAAVRGTRVRGTRVREPSD
jgi:hypothetical protein